MTTQIGASVFVDPSEIRHSFTNGNPVLTFGPYPTVRRLDLHLGDVAGIDAVIAELVALKQEMDPPGCPSTAPETGRACTETGEHDRHRNGLVVWGDEAEPVIADGEATADERLLLAVHGVSPDNPANVRELRTHEAECTETDHTPCLAHLAKAAPEADEDGPCMKVGCGHGYDDHSLDLEAGDRLYCQRCACRRFLSARAMWTDKPASVTA